MSTRNSRDPFNRCSSKKRCWNHMSRKPCRLGNSRMHRLSSSTLTRFEGRSSELLRTAGCDKSLFFIFHFGISLSLSGFRLVPILHCKFRRLYQSQHSSVLLNIYPGLFLSLRPPGLREARLTGTRWSLTLRERQVMVCWIGCFQLSENLEVRFRLGRL